MSDQIEYHHKWRLVECTRAFPRDCIIESTLTEGMKCPITLDAMEGESLVGGWRCYSFFVRVIHSSTLISPDPADTLCKHTFEYKMLKRHVIKKRNCPKCRTAIQNMDTVSDWKEY